ncbi:unnamed protein product [Caenorhabditis auriculariae]|uniref:Uncharacterized protein n=1 Tax=Caenorhabditis auriculariae TaxID=2777116 RepID=A0A8S1HLV2_9PELO|nr:unnamed protein product [Caenorhabditis auriculariae]
MSGGRLAEKVVDEPKKPPITIFELGSPDRPKKEEKSDCGGGTIYLGTCGLEQTCMMIDMRAAATTSSSSLLFSSLHCQLPTGLALLPAYPVIYRTTTAF